MTRTSTQTRTVATDMLAKYEEGVRRRDLSYYPELLYDDRNLFAEVANEATYTIPDQETRALVHYAKAVVTRCLGWQVRQVVELGAGEAPRLGMLLKEWANRDGIPSVHLCDIDADVVAGAAQRLRERFDATITGRRMSHDKALQWIKRMADQRGSVLLTQLGHNLGNYPPEWVVRFLEQARHALSRGGALLVGLDCPPVDEAAVRALVRAYNNPPTERFIRNGLDRLNRLGGYVDTPCWGYRVRYDSRQPCVRMLVGTSIATTIEISGQTYQIRSGDEILMERSYRYSPQCLQTLVEQAGLNPEAVQVFKHGGYMLALVKF